MYMLMGGGGSILDSVSITFSLTFYSKYNYQQRVTIDGLQITVQYLKYFKFSTPELKRDTGLCLC
jgi:nucleoside-specific outer membrane channel protein Tsx